jgi:hypothetical protein
MSAVKEFYEWYDREVAATQATKRRGRKPNDRQYFTYVTEQAIIAYNKEDNQIYRNKIYREHIDYPFNKLVENIYHTFKFSYFDVPYEDVKCEVVAFLNEKIDKYTEGKGKAFSYFSIIAKNYLIIQNNTNYAKLKRRAETTEIDDTRDLLNEVSLNNYQESLKDFVKQWCEWYDSNINRVFTNKRDILVADTIIELFRTVDSIENFNKKAIYILIRERTNLKTQNITKVLNVLRSDFERMFKRYTETGHIIY